MAHTTETPVSTDGSEFATILTALLRDIVRFLSVALSRGTDEPGISEAIRGRYVIEGEYVMPQAAGSRMSPQQVSQATDNLLGWDRESFKEAMTDLGKSGSHATIQPPQTWELPSADR